MTFQGSAVFVHFNVCYAPLVQGREKGKGKWSALLWNDEFKFAPCRGSSLCLTVGRKATSITAISFLLTCPDLNNNRNSQNIIPSSSLPNTMSSYGILFHCNGTTNHPSIYPLTTTTTKVSCRQKARLTFLRNRRVVCPSHGKHFLWKFSATSFTHCWKGGGGGGGRKKALGPSPTFCHIMNEALFHVPMIAPTKWALFHVSTIAPTKRRQIQAHWFSQVTSKHIVSFKTALGMVQTEIVHSCLVK